MKNNWKWLRFGGWFSLEPEGEKKKFILRRAKVHLLRVGADLLKVFLILLAIYFMSMPFWPLAVPPVPAELKAKYPIPEFQPRGNGEVEKLWFSLYPEPLDMRKEPPELLAAPLYRFSVALQDMEKEPDWTSPEAAELRGWLAEVEPEIHRMAELCLVKDPPDAPLTGNPSEAIRNYQPLINLFKVLPGLHASDGHVEAALKMVQSCSRIGAYLTRSDERFSWLAGNVLSKIMSRHAVSWYARGLISPPIAKEYEKILLNWQAERGSGVRAVARLQQNQQRMLDVVWNKAEMGGPKQWDIGFLEGGGWDFKMFARRARVLRRWGWVSGNYYRAVRKAHRNLADWTQVEAVIWGDAANKDPAQVADTMLAFKPRLGRGWMVVGMKEIHWDLFRQYFMVDADHRIGHALAAIGAYQNAHNALPTTLDEAYSAAGLEKDIQTPYVDQGPEYRRLDAGAPNETNAYAFTLTIWGDGGRCDAKGGVSWLVMQNPAFNDQPLRCWQWRIILRPNDPRGIESREVKLFPAGEKPLQLTGGNMGYLGVPAELLGTDSTRIADAERALGRLGWEEIPIPPRRNAP